jgi:hypothetical protein
MPPIPLLHDTRIREEDKTQSDLTKEEGEEEEEEEEGRKTFTFFRFRHTHVTSRHVTSRSDLTGAKLVSMDL